ncbi:hypothetical protein VTG60DRAFT_1421 [Thermothelomyces hinnuleus]
MSARRWFGAPPTQRWATAPMAVPKSSTTTTTACAVTTSKAPTQRRVTSFVLPPSSPFYQRQLCPAVSPGRRLRARNAQSAFYLSRGYWG